MVGLGLLIPGMVAWSTGLAQDLPTDDASTQLWLDYDPIISLSEKGELFGDLGVRSELESTGWGRLVFRPGYRHRRTEFTWLAAGVGAFLTVNELFANELEIRPFQGVAATWPRGWLHLQHYARLEERFTFVTSSRESAASLRARYRLRALRRFGTLRGETHWTLMATGEGFLTLAGDQGQFREELRLGLAAERSFNHRLRARAEITWQHRELAFSALGDANDIYLRLRLYHGWGE